MPFPIDRRHPAYLAMAPIWQRLRDTVRGQDAVKARRTDYLPKPGGQSEAEYQAYLGRAVWYGATRRTAKGILGALMSAPMQVDLPDRARHLTDAVTRDRRPLAALVRATLEEVLITGRFGLLADLAEDPARPGGTLVYLAGYRAEDILDWEERPEGGGLARVVLREGADRLRELTLDRDGYYLVVLWHRRDGGDWVIDKTLAPARGGLRLRDIPFVVFGPDHMGVEPSLPILLDLADINISHYRNSADYEQSLFLTAQPTPWLAGRLDERDRPDAIGAGTIWYLPEGAQVGMLEFRGTGLEALKEAMLDKERRMVMLGARVLEEPRRAAETATTVRLRAEADASILSTLAATANEAFETALRWAVWWQGIDRPMVRLTLKPDFVDGRLAAEDLQALVAAWQAGAISKRTLFDNLKDGEIVQPDRSFGEEEAAIGRALSTPGG
ncbi:MAG: DUF4055 domain-containing protein [Alphaproteobacteria bacterium]|nr:DUF4055 domain-containing protein [Alphaproteobacteria bacterium]